MSREWIEVRLREIDRQLEDLQWSDAPIGVRVRELREEKRKLMKELADE